MKSVSARALIIIFFAPLFLYTAEKDRKTEIDSLPFASRTLVPLDLSFAEDQDPRLELKKLEQVHQELQKQQKINEKDRRLLITDNRQRYNDLIMLQRKQVLAKIQKYCNQDINSLIVSFILGGFSQANERRSQSCEFITNAYYMLIKEIKSMSQGWHLCDFAQHNRYALYISLESRVLRLIDLEKNKCITSCYIPIKIGNIISLDGSIPGIFLVTGAKKTLLWNGNKIKIFSHNAPHFLEKICSFLPAYTMLTIFHNNTWHAACKNEKNLYQWKSIIKLEEKEKEKEQSHVVFDRGRQKCLISGNNVITIYSSHTNTTRHIACDAIFKKNSYGHRIKGSLPNVENIILVSKNDHVALLEESQPLFEATHQTKINHEIQEIHVNQTGRLLAFLCKTGHIIIQIISGEKQIQTSILLPQFNPTIDQIKLSENRLLCRFALSKGVFRNPVMIDISDMLYITTHFTAKQADLYTSLAGAFQLFTQYNKNKCTQHLHLTKKQRALWRTIPQKLRSNFIAYTAHVMHIQATKKRRKT